MHIPLPPPICVRLACLLLASLAVGCASWTDRGTEPGTDSQLPELKPNPRSLVLKVQFLPIEIESANADDLQSIWQWVDETAVDTATRHNWLTNGLRAGRVIHRDRFHSRLQALTSEPNAVDQFLAEAGVASEISQGNKQIPMRLGRRYELPLQTADHRIASDPCTHRRANHWANAARSPIRVCDHASPSQFTDADRTVAAAGNPTRRDAATVGRQ